MSGVVQTLPSRALASPLNSVRPPLRNTLHPARAGRGRRCCAARAGPTQWRFDDLSGSPGDTLSLSGFDDRLFREQIRAMERAQAEMADMQRQMDQRFEAAQREMEQLERAGSGQVERIGGPNGPCGYRWQQSEQQEGPGGMYRSWRSESFTVIGVSGSCSSAYAVPPAAAHLGPLSGAGLLLAAALAGFWAAATAAFGKHFGLTIYKDRSRWWMLLLWPLLLLFSSEFRQQFWAAIRGQKAGTGAQEADGDQLAPSS